MKLVPRLCSPMPIPRRDATRRTSGVCKPSSIGDRAIGPTKEPFRVCTCISVQRVVKSIVAMQSVIAVTKIVTVPAARVLIARVRCVTQRVFQQRGINGEGGRGYVVAFGTYFGRRVASRRS